MATHRRSRTPEHNAWLEMKRRCFDKNHDSYKFHGARGITVCEQWMSFENFFQDVGLRPTSAHSLDRIDNSGNYEPGNCRWATKSEQALNTRRNFVITAFGKTAPLGAFIPYSVGTNSTLYKKVWKRIKRGQPPEVALTACGWSP